MRFSLAARVVVCLLCGAASLEIISAQAAKTAIRFSPADPITVDDDTVADASGVRRGGAVGRLRLDLESVRIARRPDADAGAQRQHDRRGPRFELVRQSHRGPPDVDR